MNKDMSPNYPAVEPCHSKQVEPTISRKEHIASLAAAAQVRLSNKLVESAARKPPEAILALPPEMNPVTRYFSQRDTRPHTMAGYERTVKLVRKLLVEVGHAPASATVAVENYPWHCLDEVSAAKFANLLQIRYSNVRSRHNLLCVLREILRQCAAADLVSMKDLAKLLQLLPLTGQYQRGAGRVITEEDSVLFLTPGLTPDPRTDIRDRTIIAVFLSTGLRVSELAEIEMSDLNLDPGIRSVFIKRNKPGRSLTVHLNPSAAAMVAQWIAVRGSYPGALFDFKDRPGQALKPPSIQEMIIRRRERAGITTAYSSHDFRRTLATTALRQGTDVFVVQRLLGHKNVQATLVYDRRTELEDREAVDSLNIPGLSKPESDGAK